MSGLIPSRARTAIDRHVAGAGIRNRQTTETLDGNGARSADDRQQGRRVILVRYCRLQLLMEKILERLILTGNVDIVDQIVENTRRETVEYLDVIEIVG